MSLATYGKKSAKSLGSLSLTTVLEGDESKSAERPKSADSKSSRGALTSRSSAAVTKVATMPRTSRLKLTADPVVEDVDEFSSESEGASGNIDWGLDVVEESPPPRTQPKALKQPLKAAPMLSAAKLPTPGPASKSPAKLAGPAVLAPAKPVVVKAVKPEDAMLGPGFICPTFTSDDFGVDGAYVNPFWDPYGWDKFCGRGKAYPPSAKQPGSGLRAMMKLVRLQRDLVQMNGLRSKKYEERFSIRGMALLNSMSVDAQLTSLWEQEYDIDSIRQIFLALIPTQFSERHQLLAPDVAKLSKREMVDALVRARVPFVFFDWMQALAEELQKGAYTQHTTCEEARRRFLEFWVYCSDDEFAEREDDTLDVYKPPAPTPTPEPKATPLLPPAVDNRSGEESPTSDEDSNEPGSPVKSKRLVVVKRDGRSRHVAVPRRSNPSPSSSSSSPSRSRSPPSSRSRSPKRRSHSSKLSRSQSPRRRVRKADRSRASKSGGRSRSSKHRTRSGSPSPTRHRKRSHHSSSSSGSSRSRSGGRRSHGVQASLAKALKGFVKAAKKKPKQPKSRIQKHLDRLDEGLRSGSYIDPCAYSSAHLISIETKGSAAKDCLTFHDGHLFTDENAAEDVTNAPSSMSALKEGLHFFAQRLMSEPEFKGDVERVADRYRFIRYIEADFAAAQSSEKIPVIKEFLRRVAAKRLWCPEIPNESALFFRAFAVPATKNVHVDDDGEQIRKRQRNRARPDKPVRGARGGGGGGGRGRGGRGGGGGGPPGPALMPNLFSDDDRKRNGPCPSRVSKAGVCPSAGKPWECKLDHGCPRCPGRSHVAKNCKVLV